MNKVFFVSEQFSARLQYVIDLWNTQIFSPSLVYSSFIPQNQKFINYNGNENLYSIPNSGFLFTKDYSFDFQKVNTDIPFPDFDFFSYAFAMATESFLYSDFPKDIYGRYDENFHPVLKNHLHNYPFFPFWATKICRYLNVPIQFYPPEPLWITLDIDNPFHFQHRGIVKQMKSLLKSFLQLDLHEFFYKIKLLFNLEKDPFTTINWLPQIKKHPFLVFFLLNDEKHNSNTSPHSKYYHEEIRKIPSENLGIHFSLCSVYSADKTMKNEINILQKIVKNPIYKSRQHYLKYHLPTTFQLLIQNGIWQDYTTCFYSHKGYKHGLVRPFLWYDIEKEKVTNLWRFPIFYMDRHSLKEKMNFQETKNYIHEQVQIIQSYGGIPMILLHNETFSEQREWKEFPFRKFFS